MCIFHFVILDNIDGIQSVSTVGDPTQLNCLTAQCQDNFIVLKSSHCTWYYEGICGKIISTVVF